MAYSFARTGALHLDAQTTQFVLPLSDDSYDTMNKRSQVPTDSSSSASPNLLSFLSLHSSISSRAHTVAASSTTMTPPTSNSTEFSTPKLTSSKTLSDITSVTSTALWTNTTVSTAQNPAGRKSTKSQKTSVMSTHEHPVTSKSTTASGREGLSAPFLAPNTISTSSVSITSSISKYSTPTNMSLNSKRPVGATVGSVLGGVFGLVIIVATIFFCRHKRRNRCDLGLLRATRDKDTMSPPPSEKEDAARQTRTLSRSRAGSTPGTSSCSDTSGWHSSDTIGDKYRYGSPGRALGPVTPPPTPGIYHRELFRRHSYSETKGDAETEEDTLIQDFGSSMGSNSSRSLTSNEELERERRLEEIFKQMRSVLDNSP